jgi:hypothetical protein
MITRRGLYGGVALALATMLGALTVASPDAAAKKKKGKKKKKKGGGGSSGGGSYGY